MRPRMKLSEILANPDRGSLEHAWNKTTPADERKPLPAGEYRCRLLEGSLFNANSGTPGYKLAFEVIEGEHAGRRVWHDIWLTEAAMPMAKRDLARIGIERFQELDRPLPEGIIVSATIRVRRNDNGIEFNHIVSYRVVANEPPVGDPFEPPPDTDDDDSFDPGAR
jgi:hypothetical protein